MNIISKFVFHFQMKNKIFYIIFVSLFAFLLVYKGPFKIYLIRINSGYTLGNISSQPEQIGTRHGSTLAITYKYKVKGKIYKCYTLPPDGVSLLPDDAYIIHFSRIFPAISEVDFYKHRAVTITNIPEEGWETPPF